MAVLGSIPFGARGTFTPTLSTTIDLGTAPDRWLIVLSQVVGATSLVWHSGATIGGVAMVANGNRDSNAGLFGTAGQFASFHLAGASVPAGPQLLALQRNDPQTVNQVGYVIWGNGQIGVKVLAGAQTAGTAPASAATPPSNFTIFGGTAFTSARPTTVGSTVVLLAALETSGAGPTSFTVTGPATGLTGSGSDAAVQRFVGATVGATAATTTIAATISGSQFGPFTVWQLFELEAASSPGPLITVQPQPQTVIAGATATFTGTAAAIGGGALTFKAKKNGVDIPGATGSGTALSYSFVTALADNGGQYSFEVTETGGASAGTINTIPALLTVNAAAGPPPVMQGAIAVAGVGYRLTWQAAPGATGYRVSLNGGTTYVDVGNALLYDATNRTPGSTDQVRIQGYNANGNTVAPLVSSVQVSTSGAAPSVLVNVIIL